MANVLVRMQLRSQATVVVLVATLSLIIAGCSPPPEPDLWDEQETPTASADARPSADFTREVHSDQETRLEVPGGPTVLVPPGAVDGEGTLNVSLVPSTHESVAGEHLDLQAWDIQLDSASIVAPITITFADSAQGDEDARTIAYFNEDVPGGWEPVPSVVNDEEGTVSAEIDHLSIFSFITVPATWVRDQIVDAYDKLSSPTNVEHPRCEGEDVLRETHGITVQSDRGPRVMWCVGFEGGDQVVRITNARYYGAEVKYSVGWVKAAVHPQQGLFNSAITKFDGKFRPSDSRVVILGPGQTLTMSAAVGTVGTFAVAPSVMSHLLSNLVFAVEVLQVVALKTRIAKVDLGRSSTAIEYALTASGCFDAISRLFAAEAGRTDPDSLRDLVKNSLDFTYGCATEGFVRAYGLQGQAFAGAVLSLVASTFVAIASTITVVVDMLSDFDGYRITVAAQPASGIPDFVNGALPPGICGLPRPSMLRGGVTPGVVAGDPTNRGVVQVVISTGDVDADGEDDVAALFTCQGELVKTYPEAWLWLSTNMSSPTSIPPTVEGNWATYPIASVDLVGEEVHVVEAVRVNGDADCCASAQALVVWGLTDGAVTGPVRVVAMPGDDPLASFLAGLAHGWDLSSLASAEVIAQAEQAGVYGNGHPDWVASEMNPNCPEDYSSNRLGCFDWVRLVDDKVVGVGFIFEMSETFRVLELMTGMQDE